MKRRNREKSKIISIFVLIIQKHTKNILFLMLHTSPGEENIEPCKYFVR